MNCIKFRTILLLLFICSIKFYAQIVVPILNDIVTDKAYILSVSEKENLTKKLTKFEKETTNQIVIVTIKSLNGATIEGYTLDLFNNNKLGQKGDDNGILILYSHIDKKVRIEVGYGLEPVITDALASRIIREIMVPNFKEGEIFKGIDEASSKIIELINYPELIEEFISNANESKEEVTFLGSLFSSLFLTPVFFLLGVLGYNKILAKNKIYQKVNIVDLYKADKVIFLGILFLGVLIIGYFSLFFWKVFFAIIIISSFIAILIVGIFILLKQAYIRLKEALKGLFTGELGVFIFLFYFPFIILFFVGGIAVISFPIIFLLAFYLDFFLNTTMGEFFASFELIYFLFIVVIPFILVSLFSAVLEINKEDKIYGFSFFGNFFKGFSSSVRSLSSSSSVSRGSSRNRGSYSSSSSSSSSSWSSSSTSSSSSSFSGGGGSSGGGGASGSW